MFKKALIFLLFCMASPAWLVMRSRYGRQFLPYLFIAWGVMSGLAYAFRLHALDREVAREPTTLIDAWAVGAGIIYPFSGVLWGMQAVLMLLHRLSVGTGDSKLPRPWFAGAFPIFPGTPRIFDLIGFWMAAFIAWMFWFAPDSTFERGISLTLIPVILAFLVLAHSLRWNENTLPYRISERTRAPRRQKQKVARVAPSARTQDSLAEVFSRRDPALQRISHTG